MHGRIDVCASQKENTHPQTHTMYSFLTRSPTPCTPNRNLSTLRSFRRDSNPVPPFNNCSNFVCVCLLVPTKTSLYSFYLVKILIRTNLVHSTPSDAAKIYYTFGNRGNEECLRKQPIEQLVYQKYTYDCVCVRLCV